MKKFAKDYGRDHIKLASGFTVPVIMGDGGTCRFEKPIGDECWEQEYPRFWQRLVYVGEMPVDVNWYYRVDSPEARAIQVFSNGVTCPSIVYSVGAELEADKDCVEITRAQAEAIVPPAEKKAKHPQGLDAWKKVYYPTPADEVSKEGAAAHSLKKWEGARPAVLEAFGLINGSAELRDGKGGTFYFDHTTCALCKQYMVRPQDCIACPLNAHLGQACGALWEDWRKTGDPEPMIAALEAVVAKQQAEAEVPKAVVAKQEKAHDFKIGDWVDCSASCVFNPCVIITQEEAERAWGHSSSYPGCYFILDAAGNAWWTSGSDLTPRPPKIGDQVWVHSGTDAGRLTGRYEVVGVSDDIALQRHEYSIGTLMAPREHVRPIEFAPKETLHDKAKAMALKKFSAHHIGTLPEMVDLIVALMVDFREQEKGE